MTDYAADKEKLWDGLLKEQEELVVDTQHKDLVMKVLSVGQASWKVQEADRNEALGLTRLVLTNVTPWAEWIMRERPEGIAHLRGDLERKGIGAAEPMDIVLYDLRARIAERFNGWCGPDVGKIRTAGVVFGTPGSQGRPSSPIASYMHPRVPPAGVSAPKIASDDTRGKGVKVGMIDTKVADLSAPAPDEPIWPWEGHGTFVRALIRAQAPGAEIVVEPTLGTTAEATAWEVAVAMAKFVDEPVDVLNLSFACRTRDGQPPLLMKRAVEKLSPKTIIVAAAGNYGADFDSASEALWPAALPGVIAVGARDRASALAKFSPKVPWVRYLADGVDVPSEFPNATVKLMKDGNIDHEKFTTGVALWDGTSFAAPTVAGAIAARIERPGTPISETALRELIAKIGDAVQPYEWPNNS